MTSEAGQAGPAPAVRPGLSPDATRFTYDLKLGGVMFGVPMYGGLCHDAFLHGMIDTVQMFKDRGIPFNYVTLRNESLIQRARNHIVARFLASTCSHLFFIDADIGFTADAVLRILAHDRPIMAGLYRRKTLAEVSFAMNPVPSEHGFAERDPTTGAIRVAHAATGFLCIKREVLMTMWGALPHLRYRLYETEGDPGPWRDWNFLAFDCFIDRNGYYLSEDYGFAVRAAELGFQTWVDPAIILEHHGTACFAADPAQVFTPIGVPADAEGR